MYKLNGLIGNSDGADLKGNPRFKVRMRCAVPLYYDLVKPSHFYDIMRNPKHVLGKPFSFLETFRWLDAHTSELKTLSTVDVEWEFKEGDVASADHPLDHVLPSSSQKFSQVRMSRDNDMGRPNWTEGGEGGEEVEGEIVGCERWN